MRNKTLSFLSILALVTGLLVALAAGPALAWSYPTWSATSKSTGYPLWPSATGSGTTSASTAPKSLTATAGATAAPTAAQPAIQTQTAPSTSAAAGTAPVTTAAQAAAPAASQSAMEQQLFNLLNQDRAQNGLKPLVLDGDLSRVARMKAQDLVTNDYFDHHSPTYGWPPEMVQKAGISYRYGVGENMVETTTAERMNMQLMNSPSHRANLLDPNYTHVGIGIVPDKYGAFMAVQEFIGR